MADLSSSISQFKSWLTSRSSRELGLLAASLVVVSYFAWDRLVLSDQSVRLAQSGQQLQVARGIFAVAQSSLRSLGVDQKPESATSDKASAELEDLRKQARSIDAVLGERDGSKSAIGPLIRSLIATRHPRVTLLSLKTVAPVPVASSAAAGVFRHGVQVELSGAYLDLLAYLRSLEAGSQGAFWADARLAANTYPEVTLRLTIYILSSRSDPFIS